MVVDIVVIIDRFNFIRDAGDSWCRRRQTPVLMRLKFPVIAACCSVSVPGDRATSTRSKNAIVGTHIDGPPAMVRAVSGCG